MPPVGRKYLRSLSKLFRHDTVWLHGTFGKYAPHAIHEAFRAANKVAEAVITLTGERIYVLAHDPAGGNFFRLGSVNLFIGYEKDNVQIRIFLFKLNEFFEERDVCLCLVTVEQDDPRPPPLLSCCANHAHEWGDADAACHQNNLFVVLVINDEVPERALYICPVSDPKLCDTTRKGAFDSYAELEPIRISATSYREAAHGCTSAKASEAYGHVLAGQKLERCTRSLRPQREQGCLRPSNLQIVDDI